MTHFKNKGSIVIKWITKIVKKRWELWIFINYFSSMLFHNNRNITYSANTLHLVIIFLIKESSELIHYYIIYCNRQQLPVTYKTQKSSKLICRFPASSTQHRTTSKLIPRDLLQNTSLCLVFGDLLSQWGKMPLITPPIIKLTSVTVPHILLRRHLTQHGKVEAV